MVPATAIQRGQNGTFVYAIDADEKVSTRTVKAELRGEVAVIEEGLAQGEGVVVDGQAQLRPGTRVISRAAAGAGHGRGRP